MDEILSKRAIQDSDILKTSRIERKKKFPLPVLWIETEREIALPSQTILPSVSAELKQVAAQFKLSLALSEKEDRTIIECGRKDQIFQRLIFLKHWQGSAAKQVAIVIDDIAGRKDDLKRLENFYSLGIPITYAILPMEHLSRAAAEKIDQLGGEIIVHQPMEPEDLGHNNPGKAALLVGMSPSEIKRKLERNFRSVPYAVGISNHMGSRFTASLKEMNSFLSALKNLKQQNVTHSLFFFDSYTNPKSLGNQLSEKLGIEHLRNDIFLDNADDLGMILKQMQLLKKEAIKNDSAIAIGHIQRKYLVDALHQAIPEFRKAGIEFVHLSQLMRMKKKRSKMISRRF